MNELNEYQRDAARTLTVVPGAEKGQLAIMGLGLTGESGEVAEMLKKYLGHGHPLDLKKLERELGDVLWYLSAIATLNGLSLASIVAVNVMKLKARYPNGFSMEASQNRGEE